MPTSPIRHRGRHFHGGLAACIDKGNSAFPALPSNGRPPAPSSKGVAAIDPADPRHTGAASEYSQSSNTQDDANDQRLFVLQCIRWVDDYERQLFGRLADRQTMEILRFLAECHLQKRDIFVQDIVAFTGGYYISASKKLSLFEERGLITRKKDTVDGRRTRIMVSDKLAKLIASYLDTLYRLGHGFNTLQARAVADGGASTNDTEFAEIARLFSRIRPAGG